MRILVTNDDGIHAEGLDVCAEIGRALSPDVWIIAPEFDQSGVSHSLSLNDPLRLRAVGERRFAVQGTPTDCVLKGPSRTPTPRTVCTRRIGKLRSSLHRRSSSGCSPPESRPPY